MALFPFVAIILVLYFLLQENVLKVYPYSENTVTHLPNSYSVLIIIFLLSYLNSFRVPFHFPLLAAFLGVF